MSGEKKTTIQGTGSQYVKLNIGGCLFYTTIGTLTKQDTMLRAMFSGRMEVLTDSDGWILVDRNGRYFTYVLDYLRNGTVALPEGKQELQGIKAEADYFLVQGLSEECDKALDPPSDVDARCKVTLITSQREEQALVQASTKPVVKLCCNRHNNKYSYTNQSDDNFLRNIELFDKLSLRFRERLLFIKDVIGSNEICCWSFFGHSQKIAEVCCTSIVYGTDRKATKVEFPEARIYEETLNVLLYEDRPGPDKDLVAATRGTLVGSSAGGGTLSDEEEDREPGASRRRPRR